jgi:hypothetical protein
LVGWVLAGWHAVAKRAPRIDYKWAKRRQPELLYTADGRSSYSISDSHSAAAPLLARVDVEDAVRR